MMPGFPCWLSGEHLAIMTPKPVARVRCCVIFWFNFFLSWVVYCGYTRPRDCLLSARLTQTWPRTVTATVHEQRVKKKKKIKLIKSWVFNLVKVPYLAIFMPYFSNSVPELVVGVPVSPLWVFTEVPVV